ncbi:MAG: SPOR domain-containing protein [Holosporaceae bacterium]|jgi:hypothetical protein|nr:SPOR domain-containing protein [Holosporaceae bacterium]
MCPFLDEEDDYAVAGDLKIADEESIGGFRSQFFKNDRKFFLIGGGASVIAFCAVAYIMYSSSSPVNFEELPVISADGSPLKVKPENNEQVKHQDKMIYDSISGDKRRTEEKIAQPPEEILSIPDIETGESLSDEEKKNIIQAFDELAPEKEYKIKYVKKDVPRVKAGNLTVVENEDENEENEYRPPINRLEEGGRAANSAKKQKGRMRDLMDGAKSETVSTAPVAAGGGGNLMVQIASVVSKVAAEAEYNRILSKNRYLKGLGKRIVKVDLGEKKGIRYRIQVGPLRTRGEADGIVSSMKKSGIAAYISR